MEKKLLKLFELADALNEKQDKVFAEINYIANEDKKLKISIVLKANNTYIEKFEMRLSKDIEELLWESIIEIFEIYIGGAINE